MSKAQAFRALVVFVMAALPFTACGDDEDDGLFPGPGGGGGGSSSATFFLPTGEPDNTSAPTVEVDGDGNLHMVYPAYAGGDAYYAFCEAGCDRAEAVEVVRFETEGTVHNAMIALDDDGHPQVLLATGQKIHYATCEGDCTKQSAWTVSEIMDHRGDREVTGEAFALDPQGRPRFMMHTYKAYLGVGQKPPEAFYVACDAGDAGCASGASWKVTKIADQMWRYSTLRFDDDGAAKVATVITMGASESSSGTPTAAYVECVADCDRAESWNGIGLMPVFENELEAVRLTPSVSMALTKGGAPRVVFLGKQNDQKALAYFECDSGCAGQAWKGSIISTHQKVQVGVDLALDRNDHPRFVHTLDYNIALAFCDEDDCTAEDAAWDLTKVEYGGEMKPDKIFPYPNCTVGAWFLHSPSLALTADGRPRVGYQARDVSGGWSNPDPHETPDCVAGTDMTWSRLAVMKGVK